MGYPEAQYVIDELKKRITNIPTWINDYKIWGENSYVFNIPEMLDAVYLSEEGVNDKIISVEGLDYAINKGGTAFNTWLCGIASTKDQAATLFDGITTPDELVANADAIVAVVENTLLYDAIMASEAFMNAIITSEAFMNTIITSETAMNAIATSEAFMNAIITSEAFTNAIITSEAFMNTIMANEAFMNGIISNATALSKIAKGYMNTSVMLIFLSKINSDESYIKTMYATLISATEFTTGSVYYNDGPDRLNSYATTSEAPNAFIACACGYFNQTSAKTNVIYNGTTIVSKTGTKQPTTVSINNVNAITMAPSTFTETYDGYLAIQKFTAN